MAFTGLTVPPSWIFFLYVLIPLIIFIISVFFASRKDRNDNKLTTPESIAYLLVRFSSMISGSHFLWSLIVCANQALLIYYKLNIAKEIYYYTNVDNNNFNYLNSFYYSQVEISTNALTSLGFGSDQYRRLLEDSFITFNDDLLVNEYIKSQQDQYNFYNNNNQQTNITYNSFINQLNNSYNKKLNFFNKTSSIPTFLSPSPYYSYYYDKSSSTTKEIDSKSDLSSTLLFSSPKTLMLPVSSNTTSVTLPSITSSSTKSDIYEEQIKRRKLQASDVGSSITIAYHTNDFSNLLNYTTLTSICKIEQELLNDPYNCLDVSSYHSIIPTLFNKNCVLYRPISAQVAILASPDNSRYVVDNFDIYKPYNPIIFSYFKIGTCDNYLGTTIDEKLNEYTENENSKIQDSNKKYMITYSSNLLSNDEIFNEAFVIFYLFIGGFSFCYFLLIFTSRNFFFPAVVFFIILFSVINSASILISFGFQKFSLLTFIGVIVIILYGVNYSITFSYVWRRCLNPRTYVDQNIDLETFNRYKEDEFEPKRYYYMVNAYTIVAKSFFHSLVLSIIFLSLLSTINILVIKQFALFTLIGIITIFITFHLVAIPFWIASSTNMIIADQDEFYFWNQINLLFDKFDRSMSNYHCNFGVNSMNLCYLLFTGHERYIEKKSGTEIIINDDISREELRKKLKQDTSFYGRIKYYFSDTLKIYGVVTFIIIIIIFISTLSTNTKNYSINFNYPPYVVNKQYVLRQYTIFYNYKNDFLRYHEQTYLSLVKSTTKSPTKTPTPTIFPTRAPTILGKQPTRAPTVYIPDNLNKDTKKNYVNFYMNTCYGITPTKDGIDDIAFGSYDPLHFNNYINSLKFYKDIQNLCDYVELNRDELAIDPNWVKSRDCLYSQYVSMNDTLKSYSPTQADIMYEISLTSYGQGSLFGFLSYNKVNMPAYICPNFTLLANVSSVEENPEYILDLRETWDTVFKKIGGVNAKSFGVNQFVTSEIFTYPLINFYENSFYRIYIGSSIFIIVITILLFSAFDFILTFLSAFTMVTMILLNFSFYFMTVSPNMTSVDLICFVASVVICVQFPVQFVEEYLNSRVSFEAGTLNTDINALSPVLARANLNTREAIFIRFLAMLLLILPLLSSNLIVFSKAVKLLVICDFLTIFCVIFVMPYIIALTCKTRFLERCCNEIESNFEFEEEVELSLLHKDGEKNEDEQPSAAPILPNSGQQIGLNNFNRGNNEVVGLQRNQSIMPQSSFHHPPHQYHTSQYNLPGNDESNPLLSNSQYNSQNTNTRPSSLRTSMFLSRNNSSIPSINPLPPHHQGSPTQTHHITPTHSQRYTPSQSQHFAPNPTQHFSRSHSHHITPSHSQHTPNQFASFSNFNLHSSFSNDRPYSTPQTFRNIDQNNNIAPSLPNQPINYSSTPQIAQAAPNSFSGNLPVATGIPVSPNVPVGNSIYIPNIQPNIEQTNHNFSSNDSVSSNYSNLSNRFTDLPPPTGSNRGLVRHTSTYIPQNINKNKSN